MLELRSGNRMPRHCKSHRVSEGACWKNNEKIQILEYTIIIKLLWKVKLSFLIQVSCRKTWRQYNVSFYYIVLLECLFLRLQAETERCWLGLWLLIVFRIMSKSHPRCSENENISSMHVTDLILDGERAERWCRPYLGNADREDRFLWAAAWFCIPS